MGRGEEGGRERERERGRERKREREKMNLTTRTMEPHGGLYPMTLGS